MFLRFKNKDPGVFEENLLKHVDSLYNFAYRMTQSREEAEDLVQEASLRGFKAYHRFVEGTNFKAWLFTILRNIYINDYRRRTREPVKVHYEDVEHFVGLPDMTGAVEEVFSETLQQSMNQMPEELRTVLTLFYVEDLSYKDIAGVMQCPVGTVMSRLFMARQTLKQKMARLAKKDFNL